MAQEKPSLETLLSTSEGKKFLFLGREGIFTKEETARFLKKYNISMTKYYEEGVVGVVEHHTLNPVEEDISCAAYDDDVSLYTLVDFEKLLSEGINDDELLMGIKLANDQERIFRLLGNANINNELFVKLLSMYEWHEDEEDNTKDRDVIMFTLRRYISIKPNEEDLLYSYLTLRRLASEATDPKLLMALIGFPNFSFLVRGKQKVTLRESIAKNEYIDKEVIIKLISLRDEKVDASLACNRAVPLALLQKFAVKDTLKVNESLATNLNIDDEIFTKLLGKSKSVVALLLWWQPMDEKRLALVDTCNFESELFATIGANEQLNQEVIDTLITRDDVDLLCSLCANVTLPTLALESLYKRQIPQTYKYLAGNSALSIQILEILYEHFGENRDILTALAANRSTPEVILRELFEKDIFEINKALATNKSVPMELLDILKVDTRLQNQLAQNEVFVKEYESVLNYDRNAL